MKNEINAETPHYIVVFSSGEFQLRIDEHELYRLLDLMSTKEPKPLIKVIDIFETSNWIPHNKIEAILEINPALREAAVRLNTQISMAIDTTDTEVRKLESKKEWE